MKFHYLANSVQPNFIINFSHGIPKNLKLAIHFCQCPHFITAAYFYWVGYTCSMSVFTLALKLNSRSRLSLNKETANWSLHNNFRNSMWLHNLCAFLLTWTKWHCWVLHRLQEQTNTVERTNLPHKLITLFKKSALNAKRSISLWTWWNTLRKK